MLQIAEADVPARSATSLSVLDPRAVRSEMPRILAPRSADRTRRRSASDLPREHLAIGILVNVALANIWHRSIILRDCRGAKHQAIRVDACDFGTGAGTGAAL